MLLFNKINISVPCSTIETNFTTSVVIPTLGGKSLQRTIEQINSGTMVPNEILICIPNEDAYKTESLSFPNVKIVKTMCRGQVAQRIEGFKKSTSDLVMQLDDDVELSSKTLSLLQATLNKLGKGNVIGPVYYQKTTEQPFHKVEYGIKGFIRNIYFSMVYGARWGLKRMGTLPPTGHGFGIDPVLCETELFPAEFLPGGCVLSFKDDLVEENFFPFEGKAFCEDAIHSHMRSIRGIKHWVLRSTKCLIDIASSEVSLTPLERKQSFKARERFVKLRGGSLLRMKIYQALINFRHFLSN